MDPPAGWDLARGQDGGLLPDLRPMPSGALSFGTPLPYVAPTGAQMFAVGRIDGDNLDDLVVTGESDGGMVYLSGGDGTLRSMPLASKAVFGMALTDLNRDGKTDLVAAIKPSSAAVLQGKGDGTFAGAGGLPTALVTPRGVAAADVNGV